MPNSHEFANDLTPTMTTQKLTPRKIQLRAALTLTTLAWSIQLAHAQQTSAVDFAPVSVTVKSGSYGTAAKGTAAAIAPTQASLDATQPQSIITREFIDLSVAPTTEYSRIVNIVPSMSGEASNGPGLGETKETLRGFTDDQYNITFDGIPWGDTNNPAHHSTSFFPGTIIGGVTVERGPGNASNIGYATFGGSINLFSKKPGKEENTSLFTTLGSWNTRLWGVGYESGKTGKPSEMTLQFNYQNLQSDGYLTYSPIKAQNITLKLESQATADTLLTFFTSINNTFYRQPDSNNGATLSQIAKFGSNFQLDNDPNSLNFWGYNYTNKDTDFDYVRTQTKWGDGWTTDNSFYSYAYNNQTISTSDPTWTGTTVGAGQTANKDPRTLVAGAVTVIPGIDKQNKYRVFGDTFKAIKQLDIGVFRTGVWLDNSITDRHQYDINVLNMANLRIEKPANATAASGSGRPIDSVKFDQQSSIRSIQPFAEFAWDLTSSTQVTPGVKYVSINRSQTSPVGQTTRIVNDSGSLTYTATLPFLTVNHQINNGMSVYGQYAQGFQIPDLKTLYVAKPDLNSTEPQKSTNYQVGLVGRSDRLTWDVDAYRIEFTNKLSSTTVGTDTFFTNIGGATYQGFEGQLTAVLGQGFAAYANGSINKATVVDTGVQIKGAPEYTAALGALYDQGSWSSSLIYKLNGPIRQVDYASTQGSVNGVSYFDYYQTPAYSTVDLAVAYKIAHKSPIGKNLKVQLNVFNLTDSNAVTSITAASKTTSSPYDAYVYQTPRSFQVTLKADF